MKPSLESLRPCLDGAVPAVVATAAPDGTPNVAYVSQVHYVDPEHVALSFQFFSKTRENVLAHPYAEVQVIEPRSFRHFRLKLHYLRTEDSGPLFEYMKAQLAGIAARSGMDKVFALRGADVYRVLDIENVDPRLLPAPAPPDALLKLRKTVAHLGACDDLACLADRALGALAHGFGIRHALLAMLDETGGALYTLASLGYSASGVGAEVALGEGLIGVAAREAIPVRINYHTGAYTYHAALHVADPATPRIPLPVLANPHSQIAVPLRHGERLVGVLYAESEKNAFFSHADEDALVVYGRHLGALVVQLAALADNAEPAHAGPWRAPRIRRRSRRRRSACRAQRPFVPLLMKTWAPPSQKAPPSGTLRRVLLHPVEAAIGDDVGPARLVDGDRRGSGDAAHLALPCRASGRRNAAAARWAGGGSPTSCGRCPRTARTGGRRGPASRASTGGCRRAAARSAARPGRGVVQRGVPAALALAWWLYMLHTTSRPSRAM
jgi:adenylate cyclase